MRRWTSILKQSGLPLRSGLGQNFVVDEEIIARMAAELPAGADAVEIGCGPGNLTEALAARAGRVWAFDVDAAWIGFARGRVRASNVEWLAEDGERFARRIGGRPWCVSNLPYAAYHRLLLAIFDFDFAGIRLTLQEDVFRKIAAAPGTDEYGPLAVLASHYEVRKIFRVPRDAFYPAPRVDSVFFGLTPLRQMQDAQALDAALKRIFSKRNKKARALGADSDARVDELEPSALLELARGSISGKR
jgi:16S rRNA (adenine1518-N6/adenine1519-N6)-dimethyltransferase